jgi:LacI family transcriptional regulator
MSNVTLDMIATRLGISKFAVSRALSGKPGVSEKTRRSIIEVAEELGYRIPRMKGGDGRSIEVIFHDRNVANRELWGDVQHGIEAEASRWGLSMAVRWTKDCRIVSRVERSTVGFILVGPHDTDMHKAVRDSHRPAVTVNHRVPPLDGMDQVTATDVEAGEFVADFLIGLGHRRMVYVHGRAGYPGREARLYGFARTIACRGDATAREMIFEYDDEASTFRSLLIAMVDEGFVPTAFFCGSDGVAVTVVSELVRMGLRVPEDASVIGHADYAIASQISPKLTTLHMPHRQMGLTAVRLLLSRAGLTLPVADPTPMRISLVPHLVARQTSGPPGPGSWQARLQR